MIFELVEKMDVGLKQEKDLRELFEVESGAFASGLYASVKRARSRRTGQLFAAKHSPKRKENYNEIRLLSRLSNPYIINFKDAFETATHVVVIMEFAPGGDLQSLIDADVVLHESHASKFIHQLLKGLEYMHSKSIAHLDIKPQNLLLMGDFPQADSIIKICDFELSRVIHPNIEEREIVGTPDYVAPEILQYDPLSLKADIWSTGIVVYVLLTGFSPFGGETDTETFNNIIHNEIDFPPELFDEVVSQSGIEFIRWLCQKNVSSRPTANNALQNVWLKSNRLCNRKKGMSKSTYDLTKSREKFGEKTRLRKSKSREQLWRSKIHLSLSSEKIERWASLSAFPPTMANVNTGNHLKVDETLNNIRVQSEESLMTVILPLPVKTTDEFNCDSPIPSRSRKNSLNNGTYTNGNSNNNNNIIQDSSFLLQHRRELKPVLTTGISTMPPVVAELTHGEKIKETVGDDEVQKSVAELISKFGGTQSKTTKKCHASGNESIASNVNLDPIEEDADQEITECNESNNNSQIDNCSTIVGGGCGINDSSSSNNSIRKSIASNSTASSSGGSSRSSIDDIKLALALLLPLNLNTANANSSNGNFNQVNSQPANNGTGTDVLKELPKVNSSRNNSQDLGSNSYSRRSSNNNSNNTSSNNNNTNNIIVSDKSNNLNVSTPNTVNQTPTLKSIPTTAIAIITKATTVTTTMKATMSTSSHATTTTSTFTIPINNPSNSISKEPTRSTSTSTSTNPKRTNKFTSRYEMRIGERSNNSSTNSTPNYKSATRSSTSKVICSGAVGRARSKLAK